MSENSTKVPKFYARNPDVIVKEEDKDGALVFNPDTDQILVLNSTAFFIWQQCDGTKDIQSIIKTVGDSFDGVPPDEMPKEVEEYIQQMLTSGFIGTVEE